MDQIQLSDLPPQTEAQQQAFFDGTLELALRAEALAGARTHVIEVAETRVRLVFAGPTLEALLLPALEHLLVDGELADLTLHCWDSDSTGIEMAPPPCPRSCFTDRGDIWGFRSRSVRSAFHWSEFSLNLLDTRMRHGVYWVRSAAHLPYWAKASPLRTLLHWWMRENDAHLVHAAAIGGPQGALLITGKGGVGKSTSALACVEAGMHYVADDYLVIKLEPEPRAYTLYNTAKLDARQLDRFASLRKLVTLSPMAEGDKAVISLRPARNAQLARWLPLRAIATPCFGDGDRTEFRPISASALQAAAAFTTMSQLPHAGSDTLDFVGRLVGQVPGFRMHLGSAVAQVPDAVQTLLAHADGELNDLAGAVTNPGAGDWPLLSVIVPVYNGAHFLGQAVDAIIAQRYPRLEIIVVDDGSQDDIDAAVAALPVDVRYFSQANAGAGSARNRGIRDASGELLAFLDVDDLWPTDSLRLLVERLLATPELQVVRGHAQLVELDQRAGTCEYVGNPRESFPHYIGAALYRRSAFERIGLFDTTLRFAEDTDWFTRAQEADLPMERLDQVTLLVRRHGANMTHGKSLVELNALRVFKKALDRQRAAASANGC